MLFAVLLFLFFSISEILTPDRDRLPWNVTSKIKGFYELENNDLDVVFLGSSHSFCTFNPAVFYQQNGINSYVFGSNEQPLWLTYHYFKEVLKRQNPKVVVLESFYISEADQFKKDGVNKLSLDDLPFSWNKIEAQRISFEDNLEGINPFFNYHDRWKNLSIKDFETTEYGLLKGFTPLYKTTPKVILNYESIAMPLPAKSSKYLTKIINLAKENDVQLVLAYAPYNINISHSSHIKTVQKMADSANIPFINYTDLQLLDSIGFNQKTDFEGGHTNLYGARKVSSHLSHYLANTFNLGSKFKREDFEILKYRYEAKDSLASMLYFEDYVNYVSKMDAFVVVSAMDAIKRDVEVPFKPLGSEINFVDKHRTSYIGVFNKHRDYAVERIDSLKIVEKLNPDKVRKFYLRVESASYKKGNYSKIFINNIDQLKDKIQRGFNIVVYDAVTNQILDVANFDTFQEGAWKRHEYDK